MRLAKPKPKTKGVYIQIRDRTRRRKQESLTAEDLTPKEALRIAARAIREHQRKAG